MASVPRAHGGGSGPAPGALAPSPAALRGARPAGAGPGAGSSAPAAAAGRCRFKRALRVPAAGGEDAAVTSRPRPAGRCCSRSGGPGRGRTGPAAARPREGTPPGWNRRYHPFLPRPARSFRPRAGSPRRRPPGSQTAQTGTGGRHRDLCSSWMSN